MRPNPGVQIRLLSGYLQSEASQERRLSEAQREASAEVCKFAARQVVRGEELDRVRADEFEDLVETLSQSVTESRDSDAVVRRIAATRRRLRRSSPTSEEVRSFLTDVFAELSDYDDQQLASRRRRQIYSFLSGLYEAQVELLIEGEVHEGRGP